MALFVHYDPKDGKIVSYQEAPVGKQDNTPPGCSVLQIDDLQVPALAGKSVKDGKLV